MSTPTPIYDKDIPERNDFLDDSQVDMQLNFQVLDETFSKNHVGFYSLDQPIVTEQGKHNIVELVTRKNNQQTKSGEISLFTKEKNDGEDSIPQLFINMQNNSSVQQLTTFQNVISNSNKGYTFLPGGFIWYFGTARMEGGKGSVTLNPSPVKNLQSPGLSGKILYVGAEMVGLPDTGFPNYIISVVSGIDLIYFYDSTKTNRSFTGKIYYSIIAFFKG